MSDKINSAVAELNALPGSVPQVGAATEAPDPMKQPLWEIDERVLNPFEELPPVLTWGRMGGRPAISKEGIIVVNAKWKQGKSLAVYALLSSIVSGTPIDTFMPDPENRPRLAIVFDTEMDKTDLQVRARCVYKMLGEQRNRFMIVPVKGLSLEDCKAVIEDITTKFQPDIVALDVITNMVNDINSPAECADFRHWLDKYSKQKTVFAVIHQNKGKEDSNATGHLGSKVMQSCAESFNVTKKDGVFTLTPVNSRSTSTDNAAGVSFTLTDEGTFAGAAQILERQREIDTERWRSNFRMIFGDDETLSYSELTNRIMEREPMSKASAQRKIDTARECGAIAKTNEGRNAPYKLT